MYRKLLACAAGPGNPIPQAGLIVAPASSRGATTQKHEPHPIGIGAVQSFARLDGSVLLPAAARG